MTINVLDAVGFAIIVSSKNIYERIINSISSYPNIFKLMQAGRFLYIIINETITTVVSDIEVKVEEIYARVDEMRINFEEFNTKIDATYAKVEEMNTKIDVTNAKVEDLKSDISEIKELLKSIIGLLKSF